MKELPGLDRKAKKALEKHKNDSADAGKFAADVPTVQGKKVEFFINGKQVTKDGKLVAKDAKNIVLGKDNKLVVRAVAVGARRQQSRDLKAKKPAAITLDGTPTDYVFAYSAGLNSSAWAVKDEAYEWKVQTNKVTSTSKSASRPNMKEDTVTFVLADDIANETITLDVSGRVQWSMTGKRATGAAATDTADESETGAIVIHVAPRK